MKKIYICSQYSSDTDENVRMAKEYCRYAMKECEVIPVSSLLDTLPTHLYFTQFLDDDNVSERAMGIAAGMELLRGCDELWYFGDHISKGMVNEIIMAKELKIPVRYVPDSEWRKENMEAGK